MKEINLSTSLTEGENSKAENISDLGQAITKRLLERYKPKGLYNTEAMSDKEDQKTMALNHE